MTKIQVTEMNEKVIEVMRRLTELLELPKGWNSHESERIHPKTVADALQMVVKLLDAGVPTPRIFPTVHSGVQLEWQTKLFDFEIEFEFGVEPTIFVNDRVLGMSREGIVREVGMAEIENYLKQSS